ncbi:uncharacterized protein Tco025E_02179 [Trypanosoma conorhini]|uniref:Uncharacterized protein n=1 Tax=Trypanosoma conorhini TaxID=83891 RepID=A0A3R7NQP7_9TRYP|nr:uncharacterized protein Tco025E_02179 [Trypanosoma conorhini]RNF25590.1 hypothetical protein Tco025E_02179 [Trypanosoma conorhini]
MTAASSNSGGDGGSGSGRGAAAATKKPGIANAVPPPRKNPHLLRLATFYNTRIPLGIREFVFLGPLLIITFGIAYYLPALAPVEKFTQGITPNTKPMTDYVLEPIYDEHGGLKGYRRILRQQAEKGGTA